MHAPLNGTDNKLLEPTSVSCWLGVGVTGDCWEFTIPPPSTGLPPAREFLGWLVRLTKEFLEVEESESEIFLRMIIGGVVLTHVIGLRKRRATLREAPQLVLGAEGGSRDRFHNDFVLKSTFCGLYMASVFAWAWAGGGFGSDFRVCGAGRARRATITFSWCERKAHWGWSQKRGHDQCTQYAKSDVQRLGWRNCARAGRDWEGIRMQAAGIAGPCLRRGRHIELASRDTG